LAPEFEVLVAGRRAPLRILIADDQKDIPTLTAYQLKRSGHKVVTAKDGKQALRAFRSASFDAILLDQEMPGMTGDEVAREIRKSEDGKKKRAFLVASTGNTTLEDARRLKLAGFDDVLGKPFRLEDLNLILSSSPAAKPASESPSMHSTAPGATLAELVARVGGDEKLLKRMINCEILQSASQELPRLSGEKTPKHLPCSPTL
jgi:CheY-like chemotaxis protein